jgi:aldehyde:ferredoxin oxidoreductase
MAGETYGWTGRILRVDLTDSFITEEPTSNYSDRFLGGRGIATKVYFDEVGPDIGAFDPENRLILMAGALTGTGAQGATRLTVMGKSPMTLPERFCYANLGGFFPAYLKRAGYDGIIVSGRATKPCYLWINDGQAEIKDAEELWGKGTYEVQRLLKEQHGPKVRFISAGPAGENLARNAVIITDHEGSATGGFGAVMGSKNLKAIAVHGAKTPAVADKKALADLNRHIIQLSERGTLRMPVPKKQMQFVKTASCYQCGLECGRGLYRTSEGREEVRKCQAMALYMMFSAMRPGEPIDTSLDATRLCNDFGLCTMDMQSILFWLDTAVKAGVVSEQELGLDMASLGSVEFIEKLVTMIARREGFGDVLAEGMVRAAQKIGPKAVALFTEYTKDVGLDGFYNPREYPVTALMYGLEPRQPIAQLHDISHLIARWLLHRIRPNLSPTTAEVFRKTVVKFWKHEKAWDMTTFEGKAEACLRIQNRTYAKDSLGLCDFGWPIMDSFNTPDHTGDPTLEARLLSVVTGQEFDEDGLEEFGARIFNLQRAILLREGWQALDDDYPAEFNFTQPLLFDTLNPELLVPGPTEEPVSVKGTILDRGEFEAMRREYYELRQWDPETGLPTTDGLEKLNLPEVVWELQKIGLIAQ